MGCIEGQGGYFGYKVWFFLLSSEHFTDADTL